MNDLVPIYNELEGALDATGSLSPHLDSLKNFLRCHLSKSTLFPGMALPPPHLNLAT